MKIHEYQGKELLRGLGVPVPQSRVVFSPADARAAANELAKATGLEPSSITRYVATLEAAGFAERIPETGRIRPSSRLAQHAVSILRSLDSARQRIDEMTNRLTTQL